MSRAAVLAVVFALAPADVCGKLRGNRGGAPSATNRPPAVPVTSSTTPPIWAPPDTRGPPSAPVPTASANPDLAKARALAQAGEHKKVRTLLERKVKAGKATSEEASALLESCTALRDKACIDAVKAKHPELQAP
jgi:hypothetical protein